LSHSQRLITIAVQKLKPEIDEHDGEVVWFETIQLPNAIRFQEKLKAEQALKSGGRSNRRETMAQSGDRKGKSLSLSKSLPATEAWAGN
jgi:hypothetical protein